MQAVEQTLPSKTDNFFDLSDETMSSLAREATKAAVEDLHANGISTYGERDGIMHETKPSGEEIEVSNVPSQS